MPNDKIRMDIDIAGEHVLLTVPFEDQNRVRDTERGIRQLFETWRRRFPQRSDMNILAMVAYQYASFYAELSEQNRQAESIVDDCSRLLDELT